MAINEDAIPEGTYPLGSQKEGPIPLDVARPKKGFFNTLAVNDQVDYTIDNTKFNIISVMSTDFAKLALGTITPPIPDPITIVNFVGNEGGSNDSIAIDANTRQLTESKLIYSADSLSSDTDGDGNYISDTWLTSSTQDFVIKINKSDIVNWPTDSSVYNHFELDLGFKLIPSQEIVVSYELETTSGTMASTLITATYPGNTYLTYSTWINDVDPTTFVSLSIIFHTTGSGPIEVRLYREVIVLAYYSDEMDLMSIPAESGDNPEFYLAPNVIYELVVPQKFSITNVGSDSAKVIVNQIERWKQIANLGAYGSSR